MNNRFKFSFSVFCFLLSFHTFSAIWGSTQVCARSSVHYISDQVVNAVSYNWSFTGGWTASSTTNEMTVDFGAESGILTLNVVCSSGGDVNSQLSVEIVSMPTASFSVDSNVVSMFNPIVNFTNTSVNSTSYNWDFGDGELMSYKESSHTYEEKIATYTVQLVVFNDAGCIDTVTSEIKVEEDFVCFIPNTFTPNNDFINQYFRPIVTCGTTLLDYHLSIYNRSEGLVFESYNPMIGWDGTFSDQNKIVVDGIYTWVLTIKDGSNDKSYSLKGNVNLIR